MRAPNPVVSFLLLAALAAFDLSANPLQDSAAVPARQSFARSDEVVVKHMDLHLTVDFQRRILSGKATLYLHNITGSDSLVLDTRTLVIRKVTLAPGNSGTTYRLGAAVPSIGQPLIIRILPDTRSVTVWYETSPAAEALQWLEPGQTLGRVSPFLYTQSQPILARSWVPCQDHPGVRMTYRATVRVPRGMLALMSAENPRRISANGKYTFTMPQPVPAYLLALAVGRVEFRRIGERSGVYAEPEIAGKAVQEFVDVDSMLAVMERLWGPYRWGRYDILVLPPSFPFGGMENPRLTFVTPTIVTGDRSLVGLIAHELAHSWAGNLVTNETWNDVWLNEGMAVYLERRVTEQLWGRDRADMETDLELYDLRQTIDELGPAHPDTRLRIDLAGRAPQEVNTTVTYGKGYHFLRAIEEASGRSRMDEFLRTYFTRFAFQPMTTDRFLSFLRSNAIQGDSALGRRIRPEDWIDRPGLPTATPPVSASGFVVVDHEAKRWLEGTPARELQTGGWVAQQWIRFIRRLAPSLTAGTMVELDAAFGLSRRENAEILQEWLLCAVTHHYEPAFPALEDFLTTVGRTRYVLPLYSRMAQTPEGRARALAIYARARDGYHPLTAGRIDRLLRRERP